MCVRATARLSNSESVLDPKVTGAITEGFARLVRQAKQRALEQLTPREREVLLLVAEGATNREMGERLVISEYTARNTVSNILGKLGLDSRAKLVRWAFEHDILKRPRDPGP